MKKEAYIEGHNTTRHGGGAAVFLPRATEVFALSSERVTRDKNTGDSAAAYDYLRARLPHVDFNTETNFFTPEYSKDQALHHHLGHAAGAYLPSRFDDAAVLVVDGQGPYLSPSRYASTSIWHGHEREIDLLEMNQEDDYARQSIGLFYSSVTYYLGFSFLQEGKTMGLAPYGEQSELYDTLREYIHQTEDGGYHIHPRFIEAMFYLSEGRKYFHWEDRKPAAETLDLMDELQTRLGKPRDPSQDVTKRDKDLAWAAQTVLNEIILNLAQKAKNVTGSDNLCYAGGVALNSVANGKLLKAEIFDDIFFLPPAGDHGQALGRVLYRAHIQDDNERTYRMDQVYLGPEYEDLEVAEALERKKEVLTIQKLETEDLINQTAQAIAEGNVVGWWQGRSELGPRALGNRSILADPRKPQMRDHINKNVKHREWFRPLAPSVALEAADSFFETSVPLPYMIVVTPVKAGKGEQIPAVTHVDNSARPQTVAETQNPRYHQLIMKFGKITAVPVIMNTSFNNAGEPIVETPHDAVNSFLNMNLDHLAIGNYFVSKK